MIVIQTYYRHRETDNVTFKDYHATCGLKAEMSIIRQDKEHHDLTKYEPITIYNIFDTNEDAE